MRVLVCGARGFIGRRVTAALKACGVDVLEGVSRRGGPLVHGTLRIDFAQDTDPAVWRPRLAGVDVVVNAVGVLRDRRGCPIDLVHRATPCALFDAAAQVGVRRIVQVSALGIADSATAYARTKRAAEAHLRERVAAGHLEAAIVRPSIVFGRGGASSALFLRLAALPLLAVPRPVRDAVVQPVAVAELAEALARLVQCNADLLPAPHDGLDAVGPEPVRLGEFIASLRRQAGRRPARVLTLPDWMTALSARLGDAVPVSPWFSEAVSLLAADNVGDPRPFAAWLGRPATHYERLLSTAT